MIDYILVRGKGKLILQELESIFVGLQHRLVVGEFRWKGVVRNGSKCTQRRSRLRIWRLKDELVRQEYIKSVEGEMEVLEKRDDRRQTDVNNRWEELKGTWLKAAEETCGRTKGKLKYRRTLGWNDETQGTWKEKLRLEQDNETGTEEAKRAWRGTEGG